MSLSYTHLLIPDAAPDYRPAPAAIASFIKDSLHQGYVPEASRVCVQQYQFEAGRSYKGRTPDGQTLEFKAPPYRGQAVQTLETPQDIGKCAGESNDYDAFVEGTGQPRLVVVNVGTVTDGAWQPWTGPHHVNIRCRVRSRAVGTSAYCATPDLGIRPGEPCGPSKHPGWFVHPQAPAPIAVADAGCASFWIEVGYVKFLFPSIVGTNLAVANQAFVQFAKDCFDTGWLQGCRWG